MENLVTIITFTYAHEITIIRGKLESEGIDCFVQDELTAQVNPLYSNAIGGVKLKVRESDAERAIEILKEGGYLKDTDFEPSPTLLRFDQMTSSIPIFKELPLELRLAIAGTIVVLSVFVLFYFIT